MRIVVGYVKTPEGGAALDRAVAEARLRDATVVVVHSSRGGPRGDLESTLGYREELEAIEARLTSAGVPHEVHQLTRGRDPADDLLDVQRRSGAELIVIGVRRRSPVAKLVLGSNAQRVLLEADCPVLAVKADG